MEISITVAAYKAAKAKMGDNIPQLHTSKKKDGDTLALPLYDMSVEDLDMLAKAMKSTNDEMAPKVAKLVRSLKDPENKKIECLEDLPALLKAFLRKQDDTNLHSLQAELRGVAYLPLEVEYVPEIKRDRHGSGREAYVKMTYCFNSKHGFNTQSVQFDKREAYGTIPELLRRHNLMAPDETMVEDYNMIKRRYLKFSEMHGEQFECRGQAFETGGRWWWDRSEIDLTVFGEPSKCVLDTEHEDRSRYNRNYAKNVVHSELIGRACAVPVHPVLPVFSLVHHKTVWVNVGNMKPYTYDKQVKDRLILPTSHSRLINALVSNLDALRDETDGPDKSKILKSKAKSSIILAYGPPGTGKTLSAEVYAETIERPLYEVQAAQIGSDPESIETNMRAILNRSLRLKMPLLINEADAFVGARGKSLELDQVVAVFLRLLEYHTGLIFLTTNRDQDIDEAIKSRCIALIRFMVPARKERLQLWKVQLAQFGLELTKPDLIKAVRAFPTIVGRDIQNLIKLTHRAGLAENEKFDFENLRHYALFRGIKVLTDEEMAEAKQAELAAKEKE